MEERIAKLEAGADYLRQDVGALKTDMREVRDRLRAIEVKVEHLPSKGFIVTVVILAFALAAGLVGFQSEIQAIFGHIASAKP